MVYLLFQISALGITLVQAFRISIKFYHDDWTLPKEGGLFFDKVFEELLPGCQGVIFASCLIAIIVICLLFVLPMARPHGLLFVQVSNFLSGKTTNERFSRAFLRMQEEEEEDFPDDRSDDIEEQSLSRELLISKGKIMDPEQLTRMQGHNDHHSEKHFSTQKQEQTSSQALENKHFSSQAEGVDNQDQHKQLLNNNS